MMIEMYWNVLICIEMYWNVLKCIANTICNIVACSVACYAAYCGLLRGGHTCGAKAWSADSWQRRAPCQQERYERTMTAQWHKPMHSLMSTYLNVLHMFCFRFCFTFWFTSSNEISEKSVQSQGRASTKTNTIHAEHDESQRCFSMNKEYENRFSTRIKQESRKNQGRSKETIRTYYDIGRDS